MIKPNKTKLCFLGIICFIVMLVPMYVTIKKRAIASLVEQAQYAVYINATTSCTNHVPRDVALSLADEIRDNSSMRVIYQIKSVGFGSIYLLDCDMKPLVRIGVFRYMFALISLKVRNSKLVRRLYFCLFNLVNSRKSV